MFGNTLIIPKSGGNVTAVKINQDGYASEYLHRDATSQHTVRIRHVKTAAKNGRPEYDRHNLEFLQTVFASGETAEYQRKVYVVIEQLPGDLDVQLSDALADFMIASSNANTLSLLGWES